MDEKTNLLANKLKLKISDKGRLSSVLQKIEEIDQTQKDFTVKKKIQGLLQKGLSPEMIKTKLLLKDISVDISFIRKEAASFGLTEDEQIKNLIERTLKRKNFAKKNERELNKLKSSLFLSLRSKGHRFEKFEIFVDKYLSKIEFF